MSFSSNAKNEISRMDTSEDCCALAELSALVRMNGTIQIMGSNKYILKFRTENAAIARRIFSILKILYNTNVEIVVRKNRQLKKNNNYLILVNNKKISNKILHDVGFIDENEIDFLFPSYKVPDKIIANRCCKRSYIRGSFLGGGSISNPEKTYQ